MKNWTKPTLDVTEIRLARAGNYANPDHAGALLTKANQPS